MNTCGECTQRDACLVDDSTQACDNFDRGPAEGVELSYPPRPELCPEVIILVEDVQYLKEQMHNLEQIFAAMHKAYMGGEL